MPKRQRWTPVSGKGNRVYETRERWLLAALDLPGRAVAGIYGQTLGLFGKERTDRLAHSEIRKVLVLRLDRIGDVLMSLPALHTLRAALPDAHIRLAVGEWAEPIARRAPVDEVLVWSAPWAGRAKDGATGMGGLLRAARGLSTPPLDLVLDLQGDIRANLLMRVTGARMRVGYANTGGAYWLTHIVPLDERVSWLEQNRLAIETCLGEELGPVAAAATTSPVTATDREGADRRLAELSLDGKLVVGLHPSGGRAIKQWPVSRWIAVARTLADAADAHFVITGSDADRPLANEIAFALGARAHDLSGELSLIESLGLISRLDLFLSPDTGPMHMACAVGTPSVSVFGPSDPRRYFSGGSGAPGQRHVVVRHELWCSPCNLIRRPPEECSAADAPECLLGVSADDVSAAALRVLEVTGQMPKEKR